MTEPTAEDRYRAVLIEIVRLMTTPDTNVIGTLPSGEVGPIWTHEGRDRAFEAVIRVATAALSQPL